MPAKIVRSVKIGGYNLKDGKPRCIGCGAEVNPGLCYTGKMLDGFTFITREKLIPGAVVGETTVERYKVPVAAYSRGYICDSCASDYRHSSRLLKNGEVQSVPVVITDRLPVLTARDEREGFRSNKGFNTRIVRVK